MIRAYRIPERKSFFRGISATNQLIVANVIFYFVSVMIIISFGEKFFLENFALTPTAIMNGKTIITSNRDGFLNTNGLTRPLFEK